MSFDVEEVIDQSDESHAEKSKEEDIGLLPIKQGIVYESVFLEDTGNAYHQSHDHQKNTASHRRRPLFMFMELGEDC